MFLSFPKSFLNDPRISSKNRKVNIFTAYVYCTVISDPQRPPYINQGLLSFNFAIFRFIDEINFQQCTSAADKNDQPTRHGSPNARKPTPFLSFGLIYGNGVPHLFFFFFSVSRQVVIEKFNRAVIFILCSSFLFQ